MNPQEAYSPPNQQNQQFFSYENNPSDVSLKYQHSESNYEYASRKPPFSTDDDVTTNRSLTDGWMFRPPENGHVITTGEMISRIVQYYEMFAVNVFLLGYNVLKNAKAGVSSSTYNNVLFDACSDRFVIEQFDFCAASRLIWVLIGGAVIYFVFTSIVAFGLYLELKRKGYDASFTALWHSPVFVLCYFYEDRRRVDILRIPNKYVKLSIWTRTHVHKISLALYCLFCMIFILISLAHGTAEKSRIDGEGFDKGLKKYYNPYLIPYYLALYIFSKTLLEMLISIFQDKNLRNEPERIGREYSSFKKNE
ncbi:17381_t:CDS:2 [Acaulospora morrowiae]|uniref:17381_t:CDS:1 n=1 Tax=Acaulospora morrowiae TaxID=94023 RepID=A0A9N8Z305_9GLOM|nr:17381_t:CDS:2 [Acaulospora morrowiae]